MFLHHRLKAGLLFCLYPQLQPSRDHRMQRAEERKTENSKVTHKCYTLSCVFLYCSSSKEQDSYITHTARKKKKHNNLCVEIANFSSLIGNTYN